MNIYELEKLATPGPLTAVQHEIVAGATGAHRTIAFCYDDDAARPVPPNDPNACANASILAHCRNNFLRALEALNRSADDCKWCGGSGRVREDVEAGPCPLCLEQRKLIAELENT